MAVPAETTDAIPLTDADLVAKYDRPVPRYTSYPPATQFSADVSADTYTAWLEALPAEAPLSIYLHVPFCAELCLYCGCHTTVVRRYEPIAAYVDLIRREIALVADCLGDRRPVTHIHWGGGTPTMLSSRDLITITDDLRQSFNVASDAEIAVEIDPRTLDLSHVGAFAAMGVTRASLGVQDFNKEVQRVIGRLQSYEQTERAADWLRQAGITSLNLDLMYGLPLQSVDTVERSAETALRLRPDRIALFGYAHVPWMKRHQALLPEGQLPGAVDRLRQMRVAAAAITQAGYTAIGLDHFALPDDTLSQAQRAGVLRRNFQGYTSDPAETLIGLGTSSISALPTGFVQNESSTVAWRKAIASGRLATARGLVLTEEDRLRGEVIERLMCDLTVDISRLCRAHGREPDDFSAEFVGLEALVGDGFVQCDGYRVAVADNARPFLRNVCAVFDSYLRNKSGRHSRAL